MKKKSMDIESLSYPHDIIHYYFIYSFQIISFILGLIGSILFLLDLFGNRIIVWQDVLLSSNFRLGLIGLLLFLLTPIIHRFLVQIADQQLHRIRFQRFKKAFVELAKNSSSLQIDKISEKYGLLPEEIKNYLYELKTQRVIEGKISFSPGEGEIFEFPEGFKLKNLFEQRVSIMKIEFLEMTKYYSKINLKQLRTRFKLDIGNIQKIIENLIKENKVSGKLDDKFFYPISSK